MPDIIDKSDPLRPKILSTETGGSSAKPVLPDGNTPKVKGVVTGAILKKKKGLLDRFTETFFGDDAGTVADYIVWDVLIPAAKNTISEMVSTGIEMLLFGERGGGGIVRRDRDRGYIPYNTISRSRGDDRIRTRDDAPRRITRRNSFDSIIFESRQDASNVLIAITELVDQYDLVTVADFKAACEMKAEFTDESWGWTERDLRHVEVRPVHRGYVLTLPEPREIK